jgi:hypothetical protein
VYVREFAVPDVEAVVPEVADAVPETAAEVELSEAAAAVLPADPVAAFAESAIGIVGAVGVLKLSSRASAAPVMRRAKLPRLGIGGLLDQYAKRSR